MLEFSKWIANELSLALDTEAVVDIPEVENPMKGLRGLTFGVDLDRGWSRDKL